MNYLLANKIFMSFPCCYHNVIHTYIHTYIHAYIHTYIHTYIHACMHAYMHTCIHAYMHTCIHAYMHTCIHAYMHTCIHTYIHTYIHDTYLTQVCCLPERLVVGRHKFWLTLKSGLFCEYNRFSLHFTGDPPSDSCLAPRHNLG